MFVKVLELKTLNGTKLAKAYNFRVLAKVFYEPCDDFANDWENGYL